MNTIKTKLKNFIPLDNNIDKTIAFIPSLDKAWRDNQRIKSKPHQIETLEVLHNLIDQGWSLDSARENRSRNTRKIQNQFIHLTHYDYKLEGVNGKTEGCPNMYLTNSCDGSSPLEMYVGVIRFVCSNGLVGVSHGDRFKFNHNEKGKNNLYKSFDKIETLIQDNFISLNKLKQKEITFDEGLDLAEKSLVLRFGKDARKIDATQLLRAVREEDEGWLLWNVYNRIQENLTTDNRLISNDGKLISGVHSVLEDRILNDRLIQLTNSYI